MLSGKILCCIERNTYFQPRLSSIQTNTDFRSTRHKNLQKRNNEAFLIQLLNPFLYFTNNKFTNPMHIEEILEQLTILKCHTKLNSCSSNPCFCSIPPKNITDKFTTIRDICKFNQPGLISYTRFEEKLRHNSL